MILPYKTHGALLDLFLWRAGDWLGNGLTEPTHTARPLEGLLGWDTLLVEGLPGVRRYPARHAKKRGSLPPSDEWGD